MPIGKKVVVEVTHDLVHIGEENVADALHRMTSIYPEQIASLKSGSTQLFSDLDGDGLRFMWLLIHFGVITLSEEKYKELVEIYEKENPKKYYSHFTLDKLTKLKNDYENNITKLRDKLKLVLEKEIDSIDRELKNENSPIITKKSKIEAQLKEFDEVKKKLDEDIKALKTQLDNSVRNNASAEDKKNIETQLKLLNKEIGKLYVQLLSTEQMTSKKSEKITISTREFSQESNYIENMIARLEKEKAELNQHIQQKKKNKSKPEPQVGSKKDKLTNDDITKLENIVNQISVNKAVNLLLSGDTVFDRGNNDLFFFLLLEKLYNAGINIKIILSNHDIELIRIIEKYKATGTWEDLGKASIAGSSARSGHNLLALLKNNTRIQEKILEIYEKCYRPALVPVAYTSLDNKADGAIIRHTHAPAGWFTILSMAKHLDIDIKNMNQKQIIDAINKKFQEEYAEKNRISELYPNDHVSFTDPKKYKDYSDAEVHDTHIFNPGIDYKIHAPHILDFMLCKPFMFAAWSRGAEFLKKENNIDMHDPLATNEILNHGHDYTSEKNEDDFNVLNGESYKVQSEISAGRQSPENFKFYSHYVMPSENEVPPIGKKWKKEFKMQMHLSFKEIKEQFEMLWDAHWQRQAEAIKLNLSKYEKYLKNEIFKEAKKINKNVQIDFFDDDSILYTNLSKKSDTIVKLENKLVIIRSLLKVVPYQHEFLDLFKKNKDAIKEHRDKTAKLFRHPSKGKNVVDEIQQIIEVGIVISYSNDEKNGIPMP